LAYKPSAGAGIVKREEKDELDHVVRNCLINISAFTRGINKEIRKIEKHLDSIGVDGLTAKPVGGKIGNR